MDELLGVSAMEFENEVTDENKVICEVQNSQRTQRFFSDWFLAMHSTAEKQKQSNMVSWADRTLHPQDPVSILRFDDLEVSSLIPNVVDDLIVEKIQIDVEDIQCEIDYWNSSLI